MSRCTWIYLVIMALLLALTAGPGAAQSQAKVVTISGEIEVEEEDVDGNILTVAIIYQDEEGDYQSCIIAGNDKGKELLDDYGASVKLTGTMGANEEGHCVFTVKKAEFLEIEEDLEEP